jgi:hypothetical protein
MLLDETILERINGYLAGDFIDNIIRLSERYYSSPKLWAFMIFVGSAVKYKSIPSNFLESFRNPDYLTCKVPADIVFEESPGDDMHLVADFDH